MTSPDAMPAWPDDSFLYEACDVLAYERARAAAWEARCRVAVDALAVVALCDPDVSDELVARRAIRTIGPLHEEAK